MSFSLLVLSAVIGVLGVYPYIRAVVRGSVRPRLVSWGVWTCLAAITLVSALLESQIASAVLSVQALLGCGIVVVLGWRQGSVRISAVDKACLIGALTATISLVWLHDPIVALLVAVLADGIACMPTLIHGWQAPEEEALVCYALDVVAGGLVVAAAVVAQASFIGLVYPIFSVVLSGLMTMILLIGRFTPGARYGYSSDEV